MKYLVVLVAVVLVIIPAASALTRPGVVRVTTRNLYTTTTSAGPLQVASVYNLSLSPNPIGNAQLLCAPIPGARGPLPAGSRYCWGSYTIGRNSLVAHGVSRNPFRYELAVAGGTGQYANVGGTLNVYRITSRPLRERLVFTLTTN
jgi:hypothetical protein